MTPEREALQKILKRAGRIHWLRRICMEALRKGEETMSDAPERVTCPVCNGTAELREAIQAWDVPGAPVPPCTYCQGGTVNVMELLDEVARLREALEEAVHER